MTVRDLPIFPLPLVLFPTESRALHLFEPRYRQMLEDCRAGDMRFGLVPVLPGEQVPPSAGAVGCVAHIERVAPLPDGRSDIIVSGENRFQLSDYRETDRLYLVASATPYHDEPDPDADSLRRLVDEVRVGFGQYLDALRRLSDQVIPPTLPDDPVAFSFTACAMIAADLPTKAQRLRTQSTRRRLQWIADVLDGAIASATAQIRTQARAKRNGKRPHVGHGTADR